MIDPCGGGLALEGGDNDDPSHGSCDDLAGGDGDQADWDQAKGNEDVGDRGPGAGKKRGEVVVYLRMMHTIGMVIENTTKEVSLKKMFNDLEKIISNY